ncbi:hypothetical protein [Hoeflea sp. TYP-13]|uniref:hypothetical protein n=1 Tax=Hoeflea sp. TYP-13 TaxID=3230023 RepID=UPI0034C5C8BD
MRGSLWVRLLTILAFAAAPARAADQWTIKRLSEDAITPVMFDEAGRQAPAGLPDGRVAMHPGGDIVEAWYAEPTGRYGHGILGDAVEAGALKAKLADGSVLTVTLPQSQVFEDRTPRLADLDGEGTVEIVTIRSSTSKGASVTIYGLENSSLVERGTTGFIGRANRWLNIAGIANFDGKPGLDIAFVRTPHIGGTLFFYRYHEGRLSKIAALEGFSNHAIGSREMRLSAIANIDGDGAMELAVPSDDRTALRIIGFVEDGLAERASIQLPGRVDRAILVRGAGSETEFTIGLDDGRILRVTR